MARWTEQQVVALAPDDSVGRRGPQAGAAGAVVRHRAAPTPWCGASARGAGKTPYQVSVDLTGPAFRCSCPSRKFPCKHGLALLLLWVQGDGTVGRRRRGRRISPRSGPSERRGRAGSGGADRARPARGARPGGAGQAARGAAGAHDGGHGRLRAVARRPGPRRHGRRAPAALRVVGRPRPPGWSTRSCPGWPSRCGRWARRCTVATTGRTTCWPRSAGGGRDPGMGARETRSMRDALATCGPIIGWPSATDEVRGGRRRHRPLARPRRAPHRRRPAPAAAHLAARRDQPARSCVVLDFAAGGDAWRWPRSWARSSTATVARYPGTAPRRALFVDEPVVTATAGRRLPSPAAASTTARAGAARPRSAANPWGDRVPVVLGAGDRCAAGDRAGGRRRRRCEPARPGRRRRLAVAAARPHRRSSGRRLRRADGRRGSDR